MSSLNVAADQAMDTGDPSILWDAINEQLQRAGYADADLGPWALGDCRTCRFISHNYCDNDSALAPAVDIYDPRDCARTVCGLYEPELQQEARPDGSNGKG